MLRALSGRRLARPAALAAVFGAAGYIVYRRSQAEQNRTFEVPVRTRGADGKSVTQMKQIPFLSKDVAEKKLTENAFSSTIPRAGTKNGVWRFETAFLASNDPIEDANAQMVVRPAEKDFWGRSGDQARDVLFFAIMDGHSGFYTSRLLAKTLIAGVALELQTLAPKEGSEKPQSHYSWRSLLQSYMPFFSRSAAPSNHSYSTDPKYVSTAIQTAFANMDSEIVNAPIRAVDALTRGRKDLVASDLDAKSEAYQVTLATLLPALSGSCALLALFDDAKKDLYVAVTGDSRAVAGYWDIDKDGKGKWRVEELSQDQTGRSLDEQKRMQSEHPSDEASSVIQRGRVLGGLEPTRAFGDARYKWTREFQSRLPKLFDSSSTGLTIRPPSADLKTPPYVTSRPEITHHKIPDPSSLSSSKSSMRFVVMATDGLWDQLSSAEVVSLVGEYLNRTAPTGTPESPASSISKAALADNVVDAPPAWATGHVPQKDDAKKLEGSWTFVDKNVSTHLIRNALGGADEKQVRQMLSIPAPFARRYRDDLTVTTIWWEEQKEDIPKARL